MNRNAISMGALALCLLAAPMVVTADHHTSKEHQGRHDPVQRAEKHLNGLEKKLNLKAEQNRPGTPIRQQSWNAPKKGPRA